MSKLQKFMAKRAAIIMIFSAVAAIAFCGSHYWPVFSGLLAGTFISYGRLLGNEWIFKRILKLSKAELAAGSAVAFTISQVILILALVLAYFLSIWVMYGVIAGLLIIPFIVMVNSVTEAFGITKNNFE